MAVNLQIHHRRGFCLPGSRLSRCGGQSRGNWVSIRRFGSSESLIPEDGPPSKTVTKSNFIKELLIYKIFVRVIFIVEAADIIEYTRTYCEGFFANYLRLSQRLSWFGHINRMPETSIVKRIHKWKPFTGRPAGRPKSRWEDDVRNGLKKMKRMKWAEQVQDRLKWKDIVERAKTIRVVAP